MVRNLGPGVRASVCVGGACVSFKGYGFVVFFAAVGAGDGRGFKVVPWSAIAQPLELLGRFYVAEECVSRCVCHLWAQWLRVGYGWGNAYGARGAVGGARAGSIAQAHAAVRDDGAGPSYAAGWVRGGAR